VLLQTDEEVKEIDKEIEDEDTGEEDDSFE